MAARPKWQVAAVTALAVAPVAYLAWTRSVRRTERQHALKLLHKVDLIVAEVAVRLQHLAKKAEDVAVDAKNGEAEAATEAPESSLNSYYHFDSHGNKLRTKWDSYDVDAELQRLEEEEEEGAKERNGSEQVAALSEPTAAERRPKVIAFHKKQLLSAVAGIEREFEAVLAFLDDVRGDEDVKKRRKAIALTINAEHFKHIDDIRQLLAA